MSREDLAQQLRIERDRPTRRRRPQTGRWLLIAAAVVAILAVGGAAVWFLTVRPDLPRVETAAAQPAWSGQAARGSLLDASGYVVANREATVSAKIAGKVSQVLIEEGQHVAAGQVLARLDDTNARAALLQAQAQAAASQASIGVAQASLAGAQATYDRVRSVPEGVLAAQTIQDDRTALDQARQNLALAQRQYAAAQATVGVYRRAEDDTVVTAPFSGVVTATAAQPGEIVAPVAGGGFTRTGICTIVDMASLEVDVAVAENFIRRVAPGMPASVKLDAYPDWEIPAQVITVIPTADRSKATVTVRVALKAKDPRIVPEMGAHVAFLSSSGGASGGRAVLAPADAVQTDDRGQSVVYVIAGGRAERRAVKLGDRTSGGQIVVAGLSAGEVVAVEGSDKLRDGSGVRISRGPSR
ncbi:MAG TPA: efflux RND transporter periplasmic adaptor subunit [Caulobacteraceae bacterium]